MREFRDLAGVQWNVFRATPHTSPSKRERILPESYRLGWLVFECDRERRRLAPVPENWETLTEHELEQLCTLADVVPARAPRREISSERPTPADASAPDEWRDRITPVPSAPAQAARMQELLTQVIDEVCDQPRAQPLNTGELIRLEETLALAAHAAREAVSLRRAAREGQN